MIAQRMKELLNTGVVLDKETGEYRPVRYRDMVILTRSLQGWAEVLRPYWPRREFRHTL